MSIGRGVTNPRLLQNIALTAVVLFGLLMSYMIHITHQTVESVQAKQHASYEAALMGVPSASVATTSESDQ